MPLIRRLPTGFLGMVLLVALVEGMIATHADEFTSEIAESWRWGGASAGSDVVGADLLCFGDSQIKYGVIPRVVAGQSGLKVRNLGVLYGNAPSSYFLLRRALRAGARPSVVIINGELNPIDPIKVPKLWADLATPAEAVDLAWQAGDPKFLVSYLIFRAFPSVKTRDEIRTQVVKAFTEQSFQPALFYALYWRNWRCNQGATVIPSFNVTSPALIANVKNDTTNRGTWNCHPWNRIYLEKFLDLAGSRGIRVVWVFTPQHPEYESHYRRPNWSGLQREFVRGLTIRHPNLFVVDGSSAGYDGQALFDLVHLNRRGACALSLALGEIVRNRIQAGAPADRRWIPLPAFQDPGAADIEDIYQSMLIVQDQWSSLRR